MARSDPQVNIRMPLELKERLEEARTKTNRSLNGEIVERLDVSFSAPAEIKNISTTLDRLVEMTETKNAVIAAQKELLSMCAVFLRLAVDRVAESENPTSNRLMALTKQFANSMIHGDLEGAKVPIVEMIEIGTTMGVLDAKGQVKREFEHLKVKRSKASSKPSA
jgi:hypothetical protein